MIIYIRKKSKRNPEKRTFMGIPNTPFLRSVGTPTVDQEDFTKTNKNRNTMKKF